MLDSAEEFHSADVVFAIEYLLRRLAPIDSSVQSGSLRQQILLPYRKYQSSKLISVFCTFIASMEILDCELKSTTEKDLYPIRSLPQNRQFLLYWPRFASTALKTASGFLPTDKRILRILKRKVRLKSGELLINRNTIRLSVFVTFTSNRRIHSPAGKN